jgi:hypothetical protein
MDVTGGGSQPPAAPLPPGAPLPPPAPPADPGAPVTPPVTPVPPPAAQAWAPRTVSVEVVEPPATAPRHTDDGGGHRGVAILLAVTAIAAAIVAALSSGLASQAGDAWQSALRTETKRSAAAVTDIGSVYQTEIPQAVAVVSARLQEARLREAAAGAVGQVAAALTVEADAQKGIAEAVSGMVPLASDATYALPGGGLNLSQRLADVRSTNADLVALDPDAIQAQGDAFAAQATSLTLALWPFAFAALFGVMAEPFRRRRRLLLGLGTASFVLGIVIVLAVVAL